MPADHEVGAHAWWDSRTILASLPLVLTHPGWVATYFHEGRAGVLKRIVRDSLREVRRRPPPKSLEALVAINTATPLGRIGAPQELLYHVVRVLRPEVVVETGVYWGLSSSFILAALQDNERGRLYSIDLPGGTQEPLRSNEMTGFAVPAELRSRWTLQLGSVRDLLPPLLQQLPRIDLYYHDADHRYEEMTWEMERFLGASGTGSVLIADDIDANSAFQDFLTRNRDSVRPVGILVKRLGVLKKS